MKIEIIPDSDAGQAAEIFLMEVDESCLFQ